MAAQRVPRHDDVEAEQHDRDRYGESRQLVSIRVAVPAGDRRDQEEHRCGREEPEGEKAREPVEPAATTREERGAEDEQEVGHDAPGQGSTNDLGEAVVDRDQRDDELRRVAERRVEEAADSRPRVLRCVLGRLSDQPGERNESDRGEHELRGLREVGPVVEEDHEGGEPDCCEEGSPDHGAET